MKEEKIVKRLGSKYGIVYIDDAVLAAAHAKADHMNAWQQQQNKAHPGNNQYEANDRWTAATALRSFIMTGIEKQGSTFPDVAIAYEAARRKG